MKSNRTRALVLIVSMAAPGCHLIFGVGDPTLKSGPGGAGGNDDGGGGNGGSGGAGGSGGVDVVDPCEDVICMNENDCTVRTCDEVGDCVPEFKSGDLDASDQLAGDCKVLTCSEGLLVNPPMDDDAPPSPPGVCYEFVCSGGVASDAFLDDGTNCGTLGGVCANGLCSICDDATDCGISTECLLFECNNGACASIPAAPTTVVSGQIPGDCLSFVCMGTALPVAIPFEADLPDDANECTQDTCQDSGPSHVPVAAGDTCAQGFCDGEGHCVECALDENCETDPQGAHCDPATFSCGCNAETHCDLNPLGASCILPAGICGCANDQHCAVPKPFCNGTTRQCQASKPAVPVEEIPEIEDP